MKQEKEVSALSGYVMAVVAFILVSVILLAAAITKNPLLFALSIVGIAFFVRGFFMVYPNESRVLVLFGDYVGTVKKNGFFWTNPFYSRQKISLRARNFDSERVKVNDKLGNPIMISVILVWKVEDTYKAAFEVDIFENFVKVQSDAAVRKLAYSYPYDNFNEEDEITLVSGVDEVNEALENQLSDRLKMAGIHVIEARIGYLAYSSEIASAMLRRQQATAIVAAREKIVEGAVSMVEMALEELAQKQIIELDEEKKASMVSNLMVVLCADKDVSPVVNTGTLYQ
ncbi:regulator of protease activity HflC (stomatin/prohibitin superfamily) [Catalinimonas alkaloidigena]|uniref:SPFH domain-containing protein n=1 Tax=Catalinimonas alkaloidigena TaxID=1075417 RepID=UPI00240551B7|nr:SPFH domain-containing protein [Catalinimonas alkaloidigena]MDF9797321.1 regulator of protease activity HflC (stomatin/prohibitin superfamily) [Catalinimonas alkaloidigena]